MWFWKKKKQEDKEGKPKINKLSGLEKTTRNLELIIKNRVTRLDETEAFVKALVDFHPEVKEHPEVIDFIKRVDEFKKEKANEN